MRTRAEAVRRAAVALAGGLAACESMTPREQAQAAWTPTCGQTVEELEAEIRVRRGYDPAPPQAKSA